MSYPILYSSTEKNFEHNGLGVLSDCVSCVITEERNGIFELEMKYPADGNHCNEISLRSIIKAKANRYLVPQLFRVYSQSKPLSGIVTIRAEHISYDLSGIAVSPFEATDILSAFNGLRENAVVECPFVFTTDKTTSAPFKASVPRSIRSLLGGRTGSILDVYGGEYIFDNYNVILKKRRGQNNGVTIRYGKNLTDINQDENISNIATAIYPYWKPMEGAEGTVVLLPEKTVNAPGTYEFERVIPVDFSESFENQPTVEELREVAQKYVADNKIGVPTVNLKVSFASKGADGLKEDVNIGDAVAVYYSDLNVQATAECIKVVFDCLRDEYVSIQLGDAKKTIADTIIDQNNKIESSTEGVVDKAVASSNSLTERLNELIANAMGYYATTESSDDGRRIDYFHDEPKLSDSKIIYKMTVDGFATSTDGGETWNAGITPDGNIVAKIIEAVKIQSPTDPTVYIDLLKGVIAAKYLMDSTTNSKVQIGTDGTTSEGLFLYRDDIFRMMIATQPYDNALSGFRNWLLTRDNLWVQAADNADGLPVRIGLERSPDGTGSIFFAIDGKIRGTMLKNGYHGDTFGRHSGHLFDNGDGVIPFYINNLERCKITEDGFSGWVKSSNLRTDALRSNDDKLRLQLDESSGAINALQKQEDGTYTTIGKLQATGATTKSIQSIGGKFQISFDDENGIARFMIKRSDGKWHTAATMSETGFVPVEFPS